MAKRIGDYVKYTSQELTDYVGSKSSCVKLITTTLHMNVPPYALGKIKKTIVNLITQRKIGRYDNELKGIVLDVRNIKLMGDRAEMRFDDSQLHVNIRADCYFFRPEIGSVVKGVVCHISSRQIGVIIYRVFSVSIRLKGFIDSSIELNSEIEFRIKNFDLENMVPYIEGALVAREVQCLSTTNGSYTEELDSSSSEDDDSEEIAVETKDECELSEFLKVIKKESSFIENGLHSDLPMDEKTTAPAKKRKSTKTVKIEEEPLTESFEQTQSENRPIDDAESCSKSKKSKKSKVKSNDSNHELMKSISVINGENSLESNAKLAKRGKISSKKSK